MGSRTRIHRDHSRAGGVESNGFDGVAVDAGGSTARCVPRPGLHMVGVALGGVVGSSFFRSSGYSAEPEPRRPLTLSNMETRTLRVPKSTPATMLMGTFGGRGQGSGAREKNALPLPWPPAPGP